MKQSSKQARRSEKQIRVLLKHQQKQNMSVTAFSKSHNIHKATFYNWRNKYGTVADNPQFVPLEFAEAFTTTPFAAIS
ncbi:MAG: transposase [Ferruginibacter sp.]|nr:transposase [Ferruginibacter sp.]